MLLTVGAEAGAVASAELYQNQTYTYGRFEARVRFAASDGVISSFFMWKPGSEMPGTFWNELDFEKLGADCHLQTNPIFGSPMVDHHEIEAIDADLCGGYHTYTFEWTPSYIAYLVDGVEVRRDSEDTAAAFAANAPAGMQFHFNIWPGDASFGGNFNAASLPLQQYVSWAQYSSFADGAFNLEWREEFDGPTVPSGWAVGNWASAKNLSTHQASNVTFTAGVAVLSLTADAATGFAGAPPPDDLAVGPIPGTDPSTGSGGNSGSGGNPGSNGTPGSSGAGSIPLTGTPGADANSGGAQNVAGGAGSSGIATGGAASGTAPPSVAGASAPPADTRRPSSSDGGCSHVVSSSPRSHGTLWLALGGVALVLGQRRRHWRGAARPGSPGSLR